MAGNGSAAILAVKRSAGFALEGNLRGVLVLENFGCFPLGKAIKAHKNWHSNQQNEYTHPRKRVTRMPLLSVALKPRVDITRSPKQRYQCPHKEDLSPAKNLEKIKKIIQRYLNPFPQRT